MKKSFCTKEYVGVGIGFLKFFGNTGLSEGRTEKSEVTCQNIENSLTVGSPFPEV